MEHVEAGEATAVATGVLIDRTEVQDDPKNWAHWKKNLVLVLVAGASMTPMVSQSIYNPVLNQMERDLNASQSELALSLSLPILTQGICPVLWSTIAEIIGRKPVYLSAFTLGVVGTAVASRATTVNVLIGMRILQSAGASAVLSVGAGSLADMYDAHERGRKMGIYYAIPLLGPSIGPLLGGVLGNAYGWRSTFYFLVAFSAIGVVAFIFFPDSWRQERSAVYQAAKQQALDRARRRRLVKDESPCHPRCESAGSLTRTKGSQQSYSGGGLAVQEKTSEPPKATRLKKLFDYRPLSVKEGDLSVKIGIREFNVFPLIWDISRLPHNALVLLASGVLFGAQYVVLFTTSKTLAAAPYNYEPLKIGIVQLNFGVGGMIGALLGGRLSDRLLARVSGVGIATNTVPEIRLQATSWALLPLVASLIAYGWLAQYKQHIGTQIATLFVAGFSLMVVYSGISSYMVDCNPGRSSVVVGVNGLARGAMGCVLSQSALPLRDAIGDGGLYTLVGGLITMSGLALVTTLIYGSRWRAQYC